MFGESESESPRVPSPWDPVLPSKSKASLDRVHYHQEELLLPKLAAEVEEGNVEYKLHLISPTPTRFVRLVTQMKWRLLEGGGQAIYELGVADSGALVGLSPSDLRATLNTLRAMAAEIGARVIIAKEIEVQVVSSDALVAAGCFRSPAHNKHNGSKDNQRTAIKNLSSFLEESPRSFVSAASMTPPSSVDSTSSSTTDSHSSAPPSSSPPSPLSSIETTLGDHEMMHDDDSHFPMLALDEPHHLARGLANGGELLVGAVTAPTTKIQGRHTAPELRHVQHNQGKPQFVHDGVLQDSDESTLLAAALGKLQVADGSRVPEEEGKRIIVEAMIIRELDQEEGFLDFSSF